MEDEALFIRLQVLVQVIATRNFLWKGIVMTLTPLKPLRIQRREISYSLEGNCESQDLNCHVRTNVQLFGVNIVPTSPLSPPFFKTPIHIPLLHTPSRSIQHLRPIYLSPSQLKNRSQMYHYYQPLILHLQYSDGPAHTARF